MITEKNGVFVPFKYRTESDVTMIDGQHETKDGKKSLVGFCTKEFATLSEAEKALEIK